MPLTGKDLRVLAAGVAPTIKALQERIAVLEAKVAQLERKDTP